MKYEAELLFFRKLLRNFRLDSYVLKPTDCEIPAFDGGLRGLIYAESDYFILFHEQLANAKPNIIYRISDEYLCTYIFFRLPDMPEDACLIIGPYTRTEHPLRTILNCADKLSIPSSLFPQLEKYYTDLPLIPDESTIFTLINTFGEIIWGSLDQFSLQYVERSLPQDYEPVAPRSSYRETEEPLLSMQILEERYATENQIIHAVSHGLVHKAETIIPNLQSLGIEDRIADPVRNLKNYSIILNTLLRKGAEYGGVHPLHIDGLSSKFARRIELIHSKEEAHTLNKEMVRKYCLLVKNHSMKGYSPLIRKILTRINSDLTADLSLNTQAELLNVNASYLSTLFKKETGTTLTDYVNRRRVEYAIFLLNSTDMQIQTIAQYCGIPDVNYFTKTFKKYIQKTPKEYREYIAPYSEGKP